jgi:ribosome recycling factor
MEEELELIFDTSKEHMDKAIEHLEKALVKIRAGRANPSMLEGVRVDYYGNMTPLNQVSNINTPDARTLSVQPWEKNLMQDIEKAIIAANLGLNPMNNGEMIIINIPPLTEERRKDLVKRARSEAEDAKVGVRNARKEMMDEIKKLGKDGLSEDLVKDAEGEAQTITDNYTKNVDNILEKKESEIMAI